MKKKDNKGIALIKTLIREIYISNLEKLKIKR